MRAIQYRKFGSYDQLEAVDIPAPRPEPGEALVRLQLAPVSPLDNTARAGHFPAAALKPFPLIPGVDGVGHIVESGSTDLSPGTPVLVWRLGSGTRRDGTWRELVTASASDLLPIPRGTSLASVAAMTAGAGYLSAYLALTKVVPLVAGQTVLAPGIGGSVGQGGVEVARALGASAAISTASHTAKAELGRAAGFDVIDLSTESLREGVLRRTGGRGVDVVLDGVAGPVTGAAIASLAPGGALVSIGYSGGTTATVNVTDLIWRTARVFGFMVSSFPQATIVEANRALLDLLARGQLHPTIGRTFPLAEAAEAQRYLIEDRPYGRVLLEI